MKKSLDQWGTNEKFVGNFCEKHFLFLSSEQFREIIFLPNGHELRKNIPLTVIGRHFESQERLA